MIEFDPFKSDYRKTAHDYITVSRQHEFSIGSRGQVQARGIAAAAEQKGYLRTPETPHRSRKYFYEPDDYTKRAKDSVTKSHGFIPLPNQNNN